MTSCHVGIQGGYSMHVYLGVLAGLVRHRGSLWNSNFGIPWKFSDGDISEHNQTVIGMKMSGSVSPVRYEDESIAFWFWHSPAFLRRHLRANGQSLVALGTCW